MSIRFPPSRENGKVAPAERATDHRYWEPRFAPLVRRPARGDALLYANLDAEGRPDDRMRHAGLPVRRGEKLLASRWIR